MTRGNRTKVKKVSNTLGLVGTMSACLILNGTAFSSSTEQAAPRDTTSIGMSTINGQTLNQGQFRVSILGQFSQDHYKDADLNPESGQSKRTSTSFQTDIGVLSALQIQVSVLGDDDKDVELTDNQDVTKRNFGFRGASLGLKGRLLNHSLVRIATLPYISHVQAFKPDDLENTRGRVESGFKGVISVGEETFGTLNLYGGFHRRDPIAYRQVQIGNSYHAGAGIHIPVVEWLALGAHYQISGERFALLPEALPYPTDVPDSRTLTSRMVGGGVKFAISETEMGLFAQHSMSGHEATQPNQNTFGLHLAYNFGNSGPSFRSNDKGTTIVSDDKEKANAATIAAEETTPPPPAENIDFNVQSANGSINFDQELKQGETTQYESVDAYKIQLDEIRAAEESANKSKEQESLANQKAQSEALDKQYKASNAERAKVRKEIVEQGLEITPEDANWRGLED